MLVILHMVVVKKLIVFKREKNIMFVLNLLTTKRNVNHMEAEAKQGKKLEIIAKISLAVMNMI